MMCQNGCESPKDESSANLQNIIDIKYTSVGEQYQSLTVGSYNSDEQAGGQVERCSCGIAT
jgi:hypothetical protein